MGIDSGTLQQLLSKRRTYEDLSRFMGERITGVPNYALLLGAGCSISSGIRSGSQLVAEWRQEVFARLCPGASYSPEAAISHFTKNEAAWYNPSKEYSSLFERIYDLPRQRRMFVEKEVSSKDPNLGYAYLTKLVDNGFINTIFTTNFDDLLNEAFFRFSQTRPMVCAHDSSISSITVTSKRPKIIKLHGDYLFDDIKSTVRETESLEENTRKKFIEFGRDFGLVVIGYNGGDRSVMEVLQYLLRSDEYFKNGIYWCLRKGEQPGDELTKLLWRDRVYYVEIDGFDEVMAALHNDVIGPALPVDTSFFTDRPREIITGFCENKFLSDSGSPIIQRDLAKLKVQESRETFLSAMREIRSAADERGGGEGELSDRQFVQMMEIKRLISSDDFSVARERINAALATESRRFKEELYVLKIRLEEMAGDAAAAIAAADKLVELDPNNSEWLIRKSYLLLDTSSQLDVLAQAERIEPENYRIYDRKLDCLIDAYDLAAQNEAQGLLDQIQDAFDLSLKYDPSLRNESWGTMTSFLDSVELPKSEFVARCDGLIQRCGALGCQSTEYLRMLVTRYSKNEEDRNSSAADSVLSEIEKSRGNKPKAFQQYYHWLELDALESLKRNVALRAKLVDLASDPEYDTKRGYLTRHADFIMRYDGDLAGAIGKLSAAINDRVFAGDILKLATLLRYKGDALAIGELRQKYAASLDSVERLRIETEAYEAAKDFDGVLQKLRQIFARQNPTLRDMNAEVHALLMSGRSSEARALAKKRLEAIDWSKTEGAEIIVNYELAKRRSGDKVDKSRLGELSGLTESAAVEGCCYYLLDSAEKAKGAFQKALESDREVYYMMKDWAIFNDAAGASFLSRLRPAWYQSPLEFGASGAERQASRLGAT